MPHFIYSCVFSNCGVGLYRDMCPVDDDINGLLTVVQCDDITSLFDNSNRLNQTRIALILFTGLYALKNLIALSHYKMRYFSFLQHWLDNFIVAVVIGCFILPNEWDMCFIQEGPLDWSKCKLKLHHNKKHIQHPI